MFIMPSFKKSLIVEQFQGNYLKWHALAMQNWIYSLLHQLLLLSSIYTVKWSSAKQTSCDPWQWDWIEFNVETTAVL